MKCTRILISGRVQGVYYRASLQREAQRLGLQGYVMNLADGRVQAVVQGDETAIEALLAWCGDGPPMAEVSSVESQVEPATEAIDGFEIRR